MKSIDIKSIVERSCNLFERIEGRLFCVDTKQEHDLIEKRLNNWCQSAAEGDWEKFRLRLSQLGLTSDTARSILGNAILKPDAELPDWAVCLDEIINVYGANDYSTIKSVLKASEPIAFEELFLPFIYWADCKITDFKSRYYKIINNEVYTILKRALLDDLSQLHTRVLEMEFTVFRAGKQSPLQRFLMKDTEKLSIELYREFIDNMLKDGYLELLNEYPVLARLSAVTTLYWVEYTLEMLNRMIADIDEISNVFNNSNKLGKLSCVEPKLSDRHNQGRTVTAFHFECGLKLVYKPKDLGLEKAYYDIVAWLNSQNSTPDLKVLKVLDKGTHGWVEYAEHLPCCSIEDIKKYYERAGSLLALLHILQASDCHLENIIACAEFPVLVDAECIMHPYSYQLNKDTRLSKEEIDKIHSILRTGLLPGQLYTKNSVTVDIAGFGTSFNHGKLLPELNWDKINTDFMEYKYLPAAEYKHKNLPSACGNIHYPEEYINQIKNGFKDTYRLFNSYKSFLAMELEKLKKCNTRYVLRPTKQYADLLSMANAPKYLRDGTSRSIELDNVWVLTYAFDEALPICKVIIEEMISLESLDIPFLTVVQASDGLCINENYISDFFKNSVPHIGFMIKNIFNLDALEWQTQIISHKYINE